MDLDQVACRLVDMGERMGEGGGRCGKSSRSIRSPARHSPAIFSATPHVSSRLLATSSVTLPSPPPEPGPADAAFDDMEHLAAPSPPRSFRILPLNTTLGTRLKQGCGDRMGHAAVPEVAGE